MKNRIQAAFSEIHADDALIDHTTAYLRGELKDQRRKGVRLHLPGRVRAIAVAAVLTVGILAYSLYFTPVAYVSIDVNPSLELGLNRFDKVISAGTFNGDGDRILSGVNLEGKTYNEAARVILSVIEANGYLREDALVSVTVKAESSEKEQILCSTLQHFINEQVLSAQASAVVEVFPVTAEVWDSAHGCNISPAKYLAIQTLMEVDENATIQDYAGSTIRQIRQRTQECHDAHNAVIESGDSGYGQQGGHGHGHGKAHGNMGGS